MSTGNQVHHLLWAVAEARRLRLEETDALAAARAPRIPDVRVSTEQFVTDWQPSELGALPTA